MLSRHAVVAVLVSVLALAGSGCGATAGTGDSPEDGSDASVSAEDQACRDRWEAASRTGRPRLGVAVQRAFQTRLDSLDASAAYHAATASDQDCGRLLRRHRQALAELRAVVRQAAPYDLERRAERATTLADQRKKKLPKPARTALRTLRSRAAPADADVAPAMTQLAAVDPGDRKKVTRGLRDLRILTEASADARACARALDVLRDAGVKA